MEALQINFRLALGAALLVAVLFHWLYHFPFRIDSTAVFSFIPANEKGQVEKSWLVPGIPRDCTWAEHTNKGIWLPVGSESHGSRPEVEATAWGGCSLLDVIFPGSSSSCELVRELVSCPGDGMDVFPADEMVMGSSLTCPGFPK